MGLKGGGLIKGLLVVDVSGQFIHLNRIRLLPVWGVSTSVRLSPCCYMHYRWDLMGKRKSMFDQMGTDGRGVTRKPSHLTGFNGCTRLPVEARPLPSKSPSEAVSTSSGTAKQLTSARSQSQI